MDDFKSQVCTSVEQSKRLLELGLSRDTADMVYVTGENIDEQCRYYRVKVGCYIPSEDDGFLYIPAWSLHRLMEMYGDNYNFFSLENAFGELVEAIAIDIEKGTFKKDYLEE